MKKIKVTHEECRFVRTNTGTVDAHPGDLFKISQKKSPGCIVYTAWWTGEFYMTHRDMIGTFIPVDKYPRKSEFTFPFGSGISKMDKKNADREGTKLNLYEHD